MKAGPATPFQQRYAILAPVIDRTFDLAAILEESVGPWSATSAPEQQATLTDAFRRYTVSSYVNSFDDFNGQRFEVSPETRAVGGEQVVETKVIPKTATATSWITSCARVPLAGGWWTFSPTARSAVLPCSARIFVAC